MRIIIIHLIHGILHSQCITRTEILQIYNQKDFVKFSWSYVVNCAGLEVNRTGIAHLLIFPLDFLRVMCTINLSGIFVPYKEIIHHENQERGL